MINGDVVEAVTGASYDGMSAAEGVTNLVAASDVVPVKKLPNGIAVNSDADSNESEVVEAGREGKRRGWKRKVQRDL